MLKKLSIILTDLLIHFGLIYPLWELPGHMCFIVLLVLPLLIYLEKKLLKVTIGEMIHNRSFVVYPSFTTLFKPAIYVRPKIKEVPRKLLRIFFPLLAFMSFLMTEPYDSFNISGKNGQSVYLEELNCSFMRPNEGAHKKGILKLPRNGGNLHVDSYVMSHPELGINYAVERAFLHKDWTHYPNSIVMKGAVFVVLQEAHLDKIESKQSGTYQGSKTTTINGEKGESIFLIRVILHKDQIYNVKVSFPKTQPELQGQAEEFLNSINFD